MIEKVVTFSTDRLAKTSISIAIVLMMVFIIVEVLFRLLLGKSTLVAQEFSGYLLIYFVFVSLSFVFKKDRHIKITLITSRLPKQCQSFLELIMHGLALLMSLYMLYWSLGLTIESYKYHETAETIFRTPLVIPKAFISVGLILFTLQVIVSMAEKIRGFKNDQ